MHLFPHFAYIITPLHVQHKVTVSARATLDPTTRWTGLEVVATGPDTVEFVASWEGGRMHEVSRFEQRAGRWVYVDRVVD